MNKGCWYEKLHAVTRFCRCPVKKQVLREKDAVQHSMKGGGWGSGKRNWPKKILKPKAFSMHNRVIDVRKRSTIYN